MIVLFIDFESAESEGQINHIIKPIAAFMLLLDLFAIYVIVMKTPLFFEAPWLEKGILFLVSLDNFAFDIGIMFVVGAVGLSVGLLLYLFGVRISDSEIAMIIMMFFVIDNMKYKFKYNI